MATPTPTQNQISPAPDGVETFVEGPLGKLIVGILTLITRITVRKTKDNQGKVVEKTPLDTISGTIYMAIGLLIATIIAIRIWVWVSSM